MIFVANVNTLLRRSLEYSQKPCNSYSYSTSWNLYMQDYGSYSYKPWNAEFTPLSGPHETY